MTHLHVPDGILPLPLILAGWAILAIMLTLVLPAARGFERRHRLADLGFVAALMIVAASAEILPLAYHLNLTVMAGILLGPGVGILAATVVDVILAFFGHGGITVIGLNASILGLEVLLGGAGFRLLRKCGTSVPVAAFLATAVALAISTTLVVGIVVLAQARPSEILEHRAARNLTTFLALIYGLGSIGWLIEGTLIAGMARYLERVRPQLLGER